jgi:hypothetical protein
MTALNSDASSVVLSFLLSTPSSAHTISKLNRAFRAYVFSAFAGPLSLKSFDAIERVQPFSSVKVLDARSCAWLDDAGMKALACTTLLPALQAVDFSESPKVSSAGVKALLKARGATLKSFTQKAYTCANIKVTVSTIKALKTVTSLEFCSLTLGSGFKCGLEALSDHPTLRRLSIHFEGFTHNNLPSNLPCLEELCIETGSWANFIWPQGVHGVGHFEACSYPNCTKVVINDQVGVSMDKPPLSSRLIIALSSPWQATSAKVIVVSASRE